MRNIEGMEGSLLEPIEHASADGHRAALVKVSREDFANFLTRYSRESSRQEARPERQQEAAAPQRLAGQDIHPLLSGTEFEIYPLRVKKTGHQTEYIVAVKFTGQAEVTWAAALQEIVLKFQQEGLEQAKKWLRDEANYRAAQANELAPYDAALDSVINELHEKGQPGPAHPQSQKNTKPFPKQATAG